MLRRGTALGNRVEAHITVNRNWFPFFVFGNGPTQSTITLERALQMLVLVGVEQHEAFDLASQPIDMCGTTYRTVPHLSLFQATRNDSGFGYMSYLSPNGRPTV